MGELLLSGLCRPEILFGIEDLFEQLLSFSPRLLLPELELERGERLLLRCKLRGRCVHHRSPEKVSRRSAANLFQNRECSCRACPLRFESEVIEVQVVHRRHKPRFGIWSRRANQYAVERVRRFLEKSF